MKLKHIVIIILLLVTVWIFYAGWIQIHLEENTYGVAFTKSNGYLSRTFSPGNFSWSVYKLIPGNFKLIKFHLQPQVLTVTNQGMLPSGDVYNKFIPGQPDFSYKLSYNVTYIIDPIHLPELVSDKKLSPETLQQFYKTTANSFSMVIFDILKNKVENSDNFQNINFDLVKKTISERFKTVILLDFTPLEIYFPDRELYKKARENYYEYLDSHNKIDIAAKQKAAESEIKEASKIELLKRYGELLKQYPELIQLLAANNTLRSEILPEVDLSGENN